MKSAVIPWRWAILLLLSLFLGWLFEWLALPAALLLGPMIAAIAMGLAGVRLRVSRWAFAAAQAVVGCLMARAITPSIAVSVAENWAPMLLIVATTILAGGAVGWVLVKLRVLPGTTAAWGSTPGAASAMIAMAGDYGADMRLVAFMQYLRIIVVVMTASLVSRLLLGASSGGPAQGVGAAGWFAPVPPLGFAETILLVLFGAWIGRRTRIPAGGLLVPMLVGALLHATGLAEIVLPPWLLALAYGALGWYVGVAFNRDVIGYALRAVPQLLLATALLIALCGLSAWMLTLILHTDALTAYLATSPGGIDSVAIIAVSSHADIPFVLAIQTLRVFLVILTGPQLAKLISRYA